MQVGKERDDTRRKNINMTENLYFQCLSGFSFMRPQSVSVIFIKFRICHDGKLVPTLKFYRVQRRTSRCSLDAKSLDSTEEEGEEGNKPIIHQTYSQSCIHNYSTT